MAVGPTMRRILRLVFDSTANALKTRLLDSAGTDVLGVVTASPTSNTVLDRLKTIATNVANLATTLVLAAGTAVIGKVRLVTATGDEVTDDTSDAVKTLGVAGTALIGKVGIDQATANANEVVLKAGSAIAGRVGHDVTGIGHGVTTVTTAGTDVVLAASTPCKIVIIQAQTDNTNPVAVGATGVDATVATGTGILLYPGEVIVLEVDNLADVFIDSITNGEGVRYTYLS